MLELFIDQGNTALKWQLYEQNKRLSAGAFGNDASLVDSFKRFEGNTLSAIYVASVANSAFEDALNKWAKQCSQPAPIFVRSTVKACGLTNGYEKAEQLGVDRWLAMIAAHHKYSGMLCVVDSGTALTMDVVSAEGLHLGGFIVPGSELMVSSLLLNTQQIDLALEAKESGLGKNTTEAVLLGIEQMLQAFVNQKTQQLMGQYGQPIKVVLAGGHAMVLAKGLLGKYWLEPDLVFQGLRLMVGRTP